MFDSDFMEYFSSTPWYAVPIAYVPLIIFWLTGFSSNWLLNLTCISIGVVMWTLLEYSLHHFLFHCEKFLPKKGFWIGAHYMFHGIHHAFPMDPGRLVFPPTMGYTLYFLFLYPLISWIMVWPNIAAPFWVGLIIGYVMYDMTHYYLHHTRPLLQFHRDLKSYHMHHHYWDPDHGYGITNKVWDWVFGTKFKNAKYN